MSAFLPEGSSSPIGVAPASPSVSEDDIALMQRVFAAASARPNAIPEQFMSYVLDWLQASNLNIPIGQVFGFSQFAVQSKVSSSTLGSIVAVAPGSDIPGGPFVLSDLPNGRYIFLYGAWIQVGSSGSDGQIALRAFPNKTAPNTSQNATVLVDTRGFAQYGHFGGGSGDIAVQTSGISVVDLSNANFGGNSMTLEAWINAGTPSNTLSNPFILSLRYANL